MVRRRQPVQPLQEAIRLQPQAQPENFGPTAAPFSPAVYDFEGISRTLSGFLKQKAQDDAAQKIQAGERVALEHAELAAHLEKTAGEIKDPEEQDKYLREQFAWLTRNGVIPDMADPYKRIGYARVAGRQAASQYRDRLRRRMNEVTAVRDPRTGLVTPAPDVEAILAEEWEAYSNAPSVQNFYGGQAALSEKARVDDEFRQAVSEQRSALELKDYQEGLKQEVGTYFEYILGSNPVVDSDTLSGITAHITEEIRGHNVPNPRELVGEALELSIKKLAAVDPDEAVRAARAAQELVVGDVRLGDDRSGVGERLLDLTRQVEARAREKAVDELREEDGLRARQIQVAQGEYIPLLVRAKQEGQSLTAVARDLSERYLAEDDATGRFQGRGAFVVDQLQADARSMDAARASDFQILDQVNKYVAVGQFDEAKALADSALQAGSMTGEHYLGLIEDIGRKRAGSNLVESSPVFTGVAARYSELKPTGFAPDVQQRVDEQVLALRVRMQQDYREVTTKTKQEDPGWLEKRWLADQEAIREIEKTVRGERDVVEVQVRDMLTRFQDAGDVIDQGERQGTFTVSEAQHLREQNIQAAAGRDRLLNLPEVADAETRLLQQFELSDTDVTEPAGLSLLETARAELHSSYVEAVDAMLADPKVNPRDFTTRARRELLRVTRELTDQLFPTKEGVTAEGVPTLEGAGTAQAERAVSGGESVATATKRRKALEADHVAAASLAATTSDPASRERLNAKHPYFASVRHPDVPEDFYRAAASWMSGLDPIFGSPVRREDVELKAQQALASLPPESRGEAAASVLSVLGLPVEDVLAGQSVFRPSVAAAAAIQKEIDYLTGPIAWLPFGLRDGQVAALRARLEPVTIPLEGVELRPFTTPFFRTREALEAFQRDPRYEDFLRRIGITPEDAGEVDLWLGYQLDALERTAQ